MQTADARPRISRPHEIGIDAFQFRLLGNFDVFAGGQNLTVPNGTRGALFAALVLNAGHTVGHDDLVELVWGESLPLHPRRALHTVVARLRGWLLTVSTALPDSLVTSESGYRLEIPRKTVDLHEFRALLARAQQMRTARRQSDEVGLLRAALTLWRGRPLANVSSTVLQRDFVPTITEERNGAVDRYMALQLQHGRHEEILCDLLDAANHEPLNEKFCYQLMIAFYRSGSKAKALQVYSTLHRALKVELGVVPHPQLQQLRADIAQDRVVSSSAG